MIDEMVESSLIVTILTKLGMRNVEWVVEDDIFSVKKSMMSRGTRLVVELP